MRCYSCVPATGRHRSTTGTCFPPISEYLTNTTGLSSNPISRGRSAIWTVNCKRRDGDKMKGNGMYEQQGAVHEREVNSWERD